jgi:hypothetical protein
MITNNAHVVQIAPVPDPARWLCLDIETGDAPEEAIQRAIDTWKAPRNWKPKTVEKNHAEYATKVHDQAALLDASPILCVGLRSPSIGLMFSGMGQGHLSQIPGWSSVIECNDEAEMLIALASWLDTISDASTMLVGHNIRRFDAPKLRGAYVRHRLALPRCLRPVECGPSQPVTDTMSLFKHFSLEHRDDFMVSLDTVCAAFGIERPKQLISGAEVPQMYRDGRIAEILTYNAIDVDSDAEVYRLMMA